MRGILGIHPGWGITTVRVAMALVLIVAGWGKMNAGMAMVTGNFEKMAIPMAAIAGPFIAILELVGGALLLLGMASRWLGLLFTVEFAVAFFYVKLPAGFPGARLDLMLLAGGLLIFLAGPGKAAADSLWLEKDNRMRSRMMERAA